MIGLQALTSLFAVSSHRTSKYDLAEGAHGMQVSTLVSCEDSGRYYLSLLLAFLHVYGFSTELLPELPRRRAWVGKYAPPLMCCGLYLANITPLRGDKTNPMLPQHTSHRRSWQCIDHVFHLAVHLPKGLCVPRCTGCILLD